MQIVAFYSHLNGYEWLMHHHPNLWQEVLDVITNVNAANHKTKVSKEKAGAFVVSRHEAENANLPTIRQHRAR